MRDSEDTSLKTERGTYDDIINNPENYKHIIITEDGVGGAFISSNIEDKETLWPRIGAALLASASKAGLGIEEVSNILLSAHDKPMKRKCQEKQMTINRMQKEAFGTAVANGFHEEEKSLAEFLCLIHSEVSEALEADRHGRRANLDAYIEEGKTKNAFLAYIKDTVEDELADVVIRVADLCGYLDINLEEHIKAKMEFNTSRGYRHGKKY